MTSSRELCGQAGIQRLISTAFGARAVVIGSAKIGIGKGTFSDVYQLQLQASETDRTEHGLPPTVVAKLPAESANRDAAATAGAYRREDIAYRYLLPESRIGIPRCLARSAAGDTAAFLLDDLTQNRFVDQIDGLGPDDAFAAAIHLARFHHDWAKRLRQGNRLVSVHGVRKATVGLLAPEKLTTGLEVLDQRWAEIGANNIKAFAELVANRQRLVDTFSAAGDNDTSSSSRSAPTGVATLCHGDPRADNLCFDADGSPIFFDWQQIAVQFGEADLAWLAATSLEPEVRRSCDDRLLDCYGADLDRFRLGFVLPGLAALMLAQRVADHPRARQFISTSLIRIGTALRDYDVHKI